MEASELRIGNSVLKKGLFDTVQNWDNHVIDIDDFREHHHNPKDFKPIQLTEEWLLKLGFEVKSEYFTIEHPNKLIDYVMNKDFLFGRNADQNQDNIEWISWHLKHVHQVQNLFFALTGKELEVKESDKKN